MLIAFTCQFRTVTINNNNNNLISCGFFFYNFTVTSAHFDFLIFPSSHHCNWYKIPITLRSSTYRVVHFFPKNLWVVIPLCCQVKTAAASLCSAWHFFRCEAVWVEVMLLLGVVQASKITSAISVLRIRLY